MTDKKLKELPVSKVIVPEPKEAPTPASTAKIEYKKQDIVHNTIKDKVQLYRQTVESKEDS